MWVRGCTRPRSERAVHSDAVCNNNVQRGDSMQMTAVGGGKQSGSFRCGRLQALDPGLALHTHIADKSYINLAKQKSCSFNILMSTCFAWDLS